MPLAPAEHLLRVGLTCSFMVPSGYSFSILLPLLLIHSTPQVAISVDTILYNAEIMKIHKTVVKEKEKMEK